MTPTGNILNYGRGETANRQVTSDDLAFVQELEFLGNVTPLMQTQYRAVLRKGLYLKEDEYLRNAISNLRGKSRIDYEDYRKNTYQPQPTTQRPVVVQTQLL